MSKSDNEYTAFAFETLTVASGNVESSLTTTRFSPDSGGAPARMAKLVVGTGPLISYTYGGVTVSSATGHRATPFTEITLYGNQQIRDFRTTSVSSGTTAEITVSYFR